MSSSPADKDPALDQELAEVLGEFADSTDPVGMDSCADEPEEPAPESSSNLQESAPRNVLPLHLTSKTMSRGRPRAVKRPPTTSDLQYNAQMSAAKAEFIQKDALVNATRGRCDVAEVLRLIKAEIASEQAAIHFQRIESEKYGKDTAQISTRRIDALTKIAHIELEIKKLGADLVDLRSERFQRIFALWIDTIKQVAADTLPPELIDLFFNRLLTSMDGWEDRATDAIR